MIFLDLPSSAPSTSITTMALSKKRKAVEESADNPNDNETTSNDQSSAVKGVVAVNKKPRRCVHPPFSHDTSLCD